MMDLLVERLPIYAVPIELDACDAAKRSFDVVVSTVIFLALAPLLLGISGLVASDKGPVLFMHRRVGRGGVTFNCLKFRTMRTDAETALAALLEREPASRAEWEATRKLKRDPRVTRVGRVLRATSLDELPQLVNVLRGDMSLVGPRPVQRDELDRYYVPTSAHAAYLSVRPGITGPWQIGGRNDVGYAERVALDRAYAASRSLLDDMRILARTAAVVVRRTGAY